MVAPYQVLLHDGRLIFAPQDTDQVIRLRPPAAPDAPSSPEINYADYADDLIDGDEEYLDEDDMKDVDVDVEDEDNEETDDNEFFNVDPQPELSIPSEFDYLKQLDKNEILELANGLGGGHYVQQGLDFFISYAKALKVPLAYFPEILRRASGDLSENWLSSMNEIEKQSLGIK